LRSIPSCQSASVASTAGRWRAPPALATTTSICRARHDAFEVGGDGHIARDRDRANAHARGRGRSLPERLGAAGDQRDLRPFGSEPKRDRFADPAACPSDQRSFAAQLKIHLILRMRHFFGDVLASKPTRMSVYGRRFALNVLFTFR
jgi:hypothetical protein